MPTPLAFAAGSIQPWDQGCVLRHYAHDGPLLVSSCRTPPITLLAPAKRMTRAPLLLGTPVAVFQYCKVSCAASPVLTSHPTCPSSSAGGAGRTPAPCPPECTHQHGHTVQVWMRWLPVAFLRQTAGRAPAWCRLLSQQQDAREALHHTVISSG